MRNSDRKNILMERIMESDYYSWDKEVVRDFINDFTTSLTPKQVCDLFIEKAKKLLEDYGKVDVIKDNLDFIISSELHNLANNPNYRDHIIHSVNVFLLGHYIINKNSDFWISKNLFITETVDRFFDTSDDSLKCRTFRVSSSDEMKVFNFSWLVSSILHDLGYIAENMKIAVSQLNKIKEQFPFLKYDLKFQPKLDLGRCTAALNLLNSYFNQLNKERDYRVLDFTGFLRITKRDYCINHGIASAITYLNDMIIKQKEQNPFTTEFYLNFINWGANRSIALAMALHDIPKLKHLSQENSDRTEIQSKEENNQEEFCTFKVSMKKDPLTVLLILCDFLQDWDRERVLEGFQNNEIQRIELEEITSQTSNDKLNIEVKVGYHLRELNLPLQEEERLEIYITEKLNSIQEQKMDILNHVDFEDLLKIKYTYSVNLRNITKSKIIYIE